MNRKGEESDISSIGSSIQNYITFPYEGSQQNSPIQEKRQSIGAVVVKNGSDLRRVDLQQESISPMRDIDDDSNVLRRATLETEAMGYRLAKEIQQLRARAKRWEDECNIVTSHYRQCQLDNKELSSNLQLSEERFRFELEISTKLSLALRDTSSFMKASIDTMQLSSYSPLKNVNFRTCCLCFFINFHCTVN